MSHIIESNHDLKTGRIPKQPYGYMPPKLSGGGMGERQKDDLCWTKSLGEWAWRNYGFHGYAAGYYYTRPIDVGPGKELVPVDVIPPNPCEATYDGVMWQSIEINPNFTMKFW